MWPRTHVSRAEAVNATAYNEKKPNDTPGANDARVAIPVFSIEITTLGEKTDLFWGISGGIKKLTLEAAERWGR